MMSMNGPKPVKQMLRVPWLGLDLYIFSLVSLIFLNIFIAAFIGAIDLRRSVCHIFFVPGE